MFASKKGKRRSLNDTGQTTTSSQMDQTYVIKPAKVVVFPSELLVFNQVDGHPWKSTANLIIHNPTERSIIFKFKTNASKTILNANPCFGEVGPMSKLDVAINVRLSKKEEDDLHNVKVMVASAHPPPRSGRDDVKAVWSKIHHGQIMEHKLKCVLASDEGRLRRRETRPSAGGGGAESNRGGGTRQDAASDVSTFFVDVEPVDDDNSGDEGGSFRGQGDGRFGRRIPCSDGGGRNEEFDTAYLVQMFFYVVLGIAFTQVFMT